MKNNQIQDNLPVEGSTLQYIAKNGFIKKEVNTLEKIFNGDKKKKTKPSHNRDFNDIIPTHYSKKGYKRFENGEEIICRKQKTSAVRVRNRAERLLRYKIRQAQNVKETPVDPKELNEYEKNMIKEWLQQYPNN